MVSRKRYNREKRAREEAEVLLEQKSRELFEANQNLAREAEAVRAALAEAQELQKAEARARADRSEAMEASQDGIAITDPEGRFVYMNQSHLEMFGYRSDVDIIGKPWSSLYSPSAVNWMEENAMTTLHREGHWSGEVVGRALDGSPVDQDVSLTLKDDGGILCIARNIRERRREATERDRLREELQLAQRREIIGQISAGLAHDFNNLLAAISGNVALIEKELDASSKMAAAARKIALASDQAAGLVNRLLSLGTRKSSRVRVDLRKHLRDAVELVRAAVSAPTQLKLNIPDYPVNLNADPTDVLQVVLNLAINAKDALDGKGGEIVLSLSHASKADLSGPFVVGSVDPGREWIYLCVSDDGPGIPDAVVDKVFQPYFSTKGIKGTGLGLSIVASIVESNGGAIQLDNNPQKGTRFSVFWPQVSATVLRTPTAVAELTGRLDGKRILLVDDQEDVLAIISLFLEEAGAEVAPSCEPEDVIEALQENPDCWDLLVTDYDMPMMNGGELVRKVHEIVDNLPVVLVTALAGLAGRSSQNYNAVLGKPVERADLVAAAEEAILTGRMKG